MARRIWVEDLIETTGNAGEAASCSGFMTFIAGKWTVRGEITKFTLYALCARA